MRTPFLRAALVLALAAAACTGAQWTWTTPAVLGEDALLAELRPRDGERLVLANFWATWCGPCVAEMPELVELRPELARDGVRVVAVSLDLALPPQQVDTPEKLAAFVEHRGFALPMLAFRGDYGGLAERHGWPLAIPFSVVFGPEGERARLDGPGDRAAFEALLARARR